MALLLKTNGEQYDVAPNNGTDFTLEEMQGYVNGLIELIYLSDGRIMIINEEGAIDDVSEPNELAMELYTENQRMVLPLFGDVLVIEKSQIR